MTDIEKKALGNEAERIAEKLLRDLALTEIANIEGASDEWLEGFRFARERVRLVFQETTSER